MYMDLITKPPEDPAMFKRLKWLWDVELLQGVIDKLKKVTGARPAMKTAKGAAVLSNTDILIGKTITYIEAQIKNL